MHTFLHNRSGSTNALSSNYRFSYIKKVRIVCVVLNGAIPETESLSTSIATLVLLVMMVGAVIRICQPITRKCKIPTLTTQFIVALKRIIVNRLRATIANRTLQGEHKYNYSLPCNLSTPRRESLRQRTRYPLNNRMIRIGLQPKGETSCYLWSNCHFQHQH